MITKLGDKKLDKHNTIPVMAITVLEKMKARVLDAYYSSEGLVVRKTRLLDFSDETNAVFNIDYIMECMTSKPKGDTKNPGNILKVSYGLS